MSQLPLYLFRSRSRVFKSSSPFVFMVSTPRFFNSFNLASFLPFILSKSSVPLVPKVPPTFESIFTQKLLNVNPSYAYPCFDSDCFPAFEMLLGRPLLLFPSPFSFFFNSSSIYLVMSEFTLLISPHPPLDFARLSINLSNSSC